MRDAEVKKRDLATSKEQKINDLEKDIETFVKKFADENEELKRQKENLEQLNEHLKQEQNSKGRYNEEEMQEFRQNTAQKIDQITEALDSNMNQNQQL